MQAPSCHSRLRPIARASAALAVASVVGVSCSDAVAPPAAPPGPGATHYLLFTSSAGGAGASDIYRANGDGTERRNISASPASHGGLSVAPDRRRSAAARSASHGGWTPDGGVVLQYPPGPLWDLGRT